MLENNVRTILPAAGALGGVASFVLFVVALAAFVFQSSCTQYVQGDLGYRQPFFLMYIAHTSFIVIFPAHLLYLKLFTDTSLHTYTLSLRQAINVRMVLRETNTNESSRSITRRFLLLILIFTIGMNLPALLWYVAVSLASISDVTALWNTNSFWVYVLCVWLYSMKLEPRKLGAVLLASAGVLFVVYGGTTSPEDPSKVTSSHQGPSWPLLGDLLTLIASIFYALYQVMYKRYVALPDDPEHGPADSFPYQSLSDDEESIASTESGLQSDGVVSLKPGPPPFGLYPNLFTSSLGLCNAITMALAFPILHWLSIERFRLPPDATTFWSIGGIALGGVLFNSCFMILLGVWGPILTSVGNLLTIVLVLMTDILFSHSGVTIWGILGSVMIVSAFGVLAFDMVQAK